MGPDLGPRGRRAGRAGERWEGLGVIGTGRAISRVCHALSWSAAVPSALLRSVVITESSGRVEARGCSAWTDPGPALPAVYDRRCRCHRGSPSRLGLWRAGCRDVRERYGLVVCRGGGPDATRRVAVHHGVLHLPLPWHDGGRLVRCCVEVRSVIGSRGPEFKGGPLHLDDRPYIETRGGVSDELVEGAFRRPGCWMPASAFAAPLLRARPRESFVALGEFDAPDATAKRNRRIPLHDHLQGNAVGTQPRHRRIPRHLLAVRLPGVQNARSSGRHVSGLNLARVSRRQLRLEAKEHPVRAADQDIAARRAVLA